MEVDGKFSMWLVRISAVLHERPLQAVSYTSFTALSTKVPADAIRLGVLHYHRILDFSQAYPGFGLRDTATPLPASPFAVCRLPHLMTFQ